MFFEQLYTGWIVVVHLYCGFFLCGVRWRHNRAPNLEPRFWSISYQFEEGQRRQLCIIGMLFSISVTELDVLCNALNNLQFRRQLAPQESLICGGNIPKRRNSAAQLCEILRILTIHIVINCTRLQQHMRVTISCRYALSFLGRCFCFQFLVFFVCLAPSPERRAFEGCIVRTRIALPFIGQF